MNTWAVGDYFQMTTGTVGYEDIMIEWDQTGSGTGPRDFIVQYGTGGAITDFSTYAVLTKRPPITVNGWSVVPECNLNTIT